jgi:branched-chain amino acid transport system permease protein
MESSQHGRGAVRKKILVFIAIGWIMLLIGDRIDELRLYQGANLAMYTIGLASIVLLTGYSGQVSLGNGALMAVGAYSAALSLNNLKFPVWATFIVAIIAAAIFGMILGFAAARLSGPYLAGTTLALAVGLPAIANQFSIFGGEQGISFNIGMPPAKLGADFLLYKWFFWIATFLALISLFVTSNIVDSRFGRTWRAIRGNSLATELSGVNVGRSKVLAFSVSAGLAGLAGAVLAMTTSLVSPGSFALSLSFALVTGAVLAGISSLPGVMLGAVILVAIPEIADVVAHRLGDSERVTTHLPGLIVSVLLILSVIFTPNGPGENLRKHRKKRA